MLHSYRWWTFVVIVFCVALFLVAAYTLTRDAYLLVSNAQLKSELQQARQDLAASARPVVEPRNFYTFNELEKWVSQWHGTIKSFQVILFEGGYCAAIAERMQLDALRDGYIMSVTIVDSDCKVGGVVVPDMEVLQLPAGRPCNHVGTLVRVGNAFYYIEPQTGVITFISLARQ